MDGAGFTNGSIARHLSLPNRDQHLLIGPWDHGARTNISPWRSSAEAKFDVMAEVVRFFDHYLMDRDTGLQAERPIHYFSLHEERWRSEEHTSELQSLMRISYAVFCLKKKKHQQHPHTHPTK